MAKTPWEKHDRERHSPCQITLLALTSSLFFPYSGHGPFEISRFKSTESKALPPFAEKENGRTGD
jgi:hypothetical protein